MIGIVAGVLICLGQGVHELFCCKDTFPLQHKHPPRDPVATAQQDQFKIPKSAPEEYSSLPGGAKTAAICRQLSGVPYWLYTQDGKEYLTCHAGNVAGVTH